MGQNQPTKTSLGGLYIRNYTANLAGNFIIALLNTFTPLEVLRDWQAFLRQGGWIWLLS